LENSRDKSLKFDANLAGFRRTWYEKLHIMDRTPGTD